MPWLWIVSGYSDIASSSTLSTYALTPFASARIAAMPMMPMLPAKAVISVRPFLVMRLLKDSANAVKNDMDVLLTPVSL